MRITFLLAIVLITSSCSNDLVEPEISNTRKMDFTEALLTTSDTTSVVDESVVKRVANNFMSKIVDSRSTLLEQTISELRDTDETVIAHIINFGEKNGFVVVSANKDCYPVVAYSSEGRMDLNTIRGTISEKLIREMTSTTSKDYNQMMSSDIARAWHKLTSTKSSFLNSSRSTLDDVSQTTNAAIAEWNRQGYEVVNISSANPNIYPESIRQVIQDLKGSLTLYNAPGFVLSRETTKTYSVAPLLKSKWNESYPYNAALPSPLTQFLPTTGVAVARIIHYHDSPKSLNLISMPLSLSTANADDPLPKLLLLISRMCNYDNFNDAVSSINNAMIGLQAEGYSYSTGKFGKFNMYDQLKNFGPVYMQYIKNSNNTYVNFNWICDGTSSVETTTEYKVVQYTGDFADIDPLAAFATLRSTNSYASSVPAYHMDFGGGNKLNGYYFNSNWTLNLTSGYTITIDGNSVETIYNIKPKS